MVERAKRDEIEKALEFEQEEPCSHDLPVPPSSQVLSLPPDKLETLSRNREITLLVYGWHNAHPGEMTWKFDSVEAAILAAKAMRNASAWLIFSGSHATFEEARVNAEILAEYSV